ncbi:MAG TPA: peroxide stress protein YaaA [Candidatus Thioglobus sp.]|jgi:hypothetical protein|nr:peroxide stress protein YaaA [Candidatus Thioglobus sp.]HIL43201.1 peroxide stress protein YaaA [Gammaproteobacteria bacterium]
MILVISPSKTQDFSSTDMLSYSNPRQILESEELMQILKNKSQNQIASLMSISDKLSKLNYDRFKSFSTPLTLENAKQAILSFKGDVYSGIDVDSLTQDDLDFAQTKIRMISGLYGVLRPLDLISPYRLEMSTKLKNSIGDNLYQFWGDKISNALNEDESEVIINLASNEYFKAIQKKSLKAKVINIAFKENKDNKYRIIGIYAKRARGLMAKYMIDNRILIPEGLKGFDIEGYRFRDELSDDSNWEFTRDLIN